MNNIVERLRKVYNDLADEATDEIERLELLFKVKEHTECFLENERLSSIETVLNELVKLKALKDRYGKTPDYLIRQPIAWEAARVALDE